MAWAIRAELLANDVVDIDSCVNELITENRSWSRTLIESFVLDDSGESIDSTLPR